MHGSLESLAGKRILVVEDETMIALMAADMLVELGAVVVGPAATLAQAMALIEREAIDAALIDINLGGTRSESLVERLRHLDVPFVIASGYVLSPGGTDGAPRLAKPYSKANLASALSAAVAKPAT